MYLISTDVTYYVPNNSYNYNNDSIIYLNESNTVTDKSDFDNLELDNVDLTSSIDMNLNQDISVNAFDLSDSSLFNFINEIDFLTNDTTSSINSPTTSIEYTEEYTHKIEEYTESNFDSFSSSSSPSMNDSSDQEKPYLEYGIRRNQEMVKTKRRIDKRESNKAAASRYRSKKSKEKDQLFAQCEIYEKANIELKEKIDNIESEINSIRNLLVHALLIKQNVLSSNNILTSSPLNVGHN